MIYNSLELCGRYEKANSIKTTWDTQYRQVFEYCMPARDGYAKATGSEKIDPNFQDRRANLYSSAGEQAANEFVNTMQEVLCPPQANWIDLEAGYKFKAEDRADINMELSKLAELANEYKNCSTFDMAFSEFCYDLFAGTACMSIMAGTPYNPLVFKAIPIREYCVEEGADGTVHSVYRKFTMTREQIGYMWRELAKKQFSKTDKEKDIELLECTYYDQDLDEYVYEVINYAAKETMLSKRFKSNPFIVLRWNKCAGEAYGRGCGLTALNDIKTLNLIKEYGLRALAFNLPPLLVQEDAMLDVESLELTPFSLNVVPDTKTSIVPLALGQTNPNIEQYKVQELQMEIKKNTYGNTLPNEGNRQLTATEINARQLEMRKSLSSVFGRLISEGQIPMVRRIFDVLISTKKVSEEFDLTKINGIIYKVKINSPIIRQLKGQEAQAIAMSAQMLVQLDPTGQALATMMKVNEAAAHMLELMGVPLKFIMQPNESKAKEEQMAQAQAQAQQAAVATDVEAQNAMAMGKANANVAEKQALE